MTATAPKQHADVVLDTRPLSYAVGEEILGVDLSKDLDDAVIAAIRAVLVDRGAVVFRGQSLPPAQQVAFTRRFGELHYMAVDRYNHPEHPEIFLITNKPVEGEPSQTRNTGRQWHSDHSFAERPAMGTLLYCLECPKVGGTTLLANQVMAYDALPETVKKMLDGRRAWHDLHRLKDFRNRPGFDNSERARTPERLQPIFRTHPETGRKAIFVNEAWTYKIEGCTEEESRPILEMLFAHQTQPLFTYRHIWQPGDLLFWENRVVQHYAPPDYDMSDPANVRHMHRTTVAGDPAY